MRTVNYVKVHINMVAPRTQAAVRVYRISGPNWTVILFKGIHIFANNFSSVTKLLYISDFMSVKKPRVSSIFPTAKLTIRLASVIKLTSVLMTSTIPRSFAATAFNRLPNTSASRCALPLGTFTLKGRRIWNVQAVWYQYDKNTLVHEWS